MWMIELAMNTITAARMMGSHSAETATMDFSPLRRLLAVVPRNAIAPRGLRQDGCWLCYGYFGQWYPPTPSPLEILCFHGVGRKLGIRTLHSIGYRQNIHSQGFTGAHDSVSASSGRVRRPVVLRKAS